MRAVFCASLLGCLPLFAQTPAPKAGPSTAPAPAAAPPDRVDNRDIGFSYALPPDWSPAPPPSAPTIIVPYPNALQAPKGDACVKVVLTAKHSAPGAAVVITALPFACYGQAIKPGDLIDFAAGGADGLKQTCTVSDPVQTNYSLGSHAFWIERVEATPKGRPNPPFTIEIACTILAKGAVCWTAIATDAASLQAFEKTPVTLEDEHFPALVPAHVFSPNP